MISLEQARALIAEKLQPLTSMRMRLSAARGRVLREAIVAPHDFPPFDRSAMDGYAVALDDHSERFRVVAEVQAGSISERAIAAGECARVFTGAQIPPGASQVIMQEDVERTEEWMIPRTRDRTTHVRLRGEDARAGTPLLHIGQRLGACDVSLLAHLGAVEPLVSRTPRVVHVVTGRELVPPEQLPAAGQIRDTNSSLIGALLAEDGVELAGQIRCGDDLAETVAAVRSVAESAWDVLIISGGASVGEYDFGARALRELGFASHFDRINLRPGKPLIFATRGSQAAFVIPGNPVSHFVTYHVAIRSAFELLEGITPAFDVVRLVLESPLPNEANPRETWWPARVIVRDGNLHAQPLAWQSSGDLCGLAGANGLLRILPSQGPRATGETIDGLCLGFQI
jgi:molybdopterin molybdotransferase